MIITVGNTKGGVGKTTLAVSLAISRALSGRDVWLIDGDRQGTAQTAISIRAESEVSRVLLVQHIRMARLCEARYSSRWPNSMMSSLMQVVVIPRLYELLWC